MMLAKTRKWGNSIGVVLPKKTVETLRIKAGDEILLDIQQKKDPLQELFGQKEKIGIAALKQYRKGLESRY